MASRKQHSGPPHRQARLSRGQAAEAREKLAAGGLSHKERHKLVSAVRARDEAASRRSLETRHVIMAVAGTLIAMAVVGAMVGLVPAIHAASGQGTRGTFIVEPQLCVHRCTRTAGSFRYADGETVPDLVYAGSLPLDAHPGTTLPAIRPGGSEFVYPPHGSLSWISDVAIMVVVGCAVGFLLLASTLGLRRRNTSRTGLA
ncbi:MAG TPA: hypothetical protein VMC83_02260 [Streptosporangiaceae bacterium]|nr:hypothetical protein [Streptosporangiaceae bacterium]